jgi:hypothetical protein
MDQTQKFRNVLNDFMRRFSDYQETQMKFVSDFPVGNVTGIAKK